MVGLKTNTDVMMKALGRDPDISITFPKTGMVLTRWRHFLEQYEQIGLPNPCYCVHLSGKQEVRYWSGEDWSANSSAPGFASRIPVDEPLRIWVNGELDVASLAMPRPCSSNRSVMFGYNDPLGVQLTRQILSEAYASFGEVSEYQLALMAALEAHVLRDNALDQQRPVIPTAAFSARRIHTIVDHIQARPELEHSLETLAAMAGVTPPHFCRMFKRATGFAPRQYVNKVRIDRARSMLESTDTSISQIATRLGFNNQCHFNRLFRSMTGLTPGECRATERTAGGIVLK